VEIFSDCPNICSETGLKVNIQCEDRRGAVGGFREKRKSWNKLRGCG
jgi:hypothetical protein